MKWMGFAYVPNSHYWTHSLTVLYSCGMFWRKEILLKFPVAPFCCRVVWWLSGHKEKRSIGLIAAAANVSINHHVSLKPTVNHCVRAGALRRRQGKFSCFLQQNPVISDMWRGEKKHLRLDRSISVNWRTYKVPFKSTVPHRNDTLPFILNEALKSSHTVPVITIRPVKVKHWFWVTFGPRNPFSFGWLCVRASRTSQNKDHMCLSNANQTPGWKWPASSCRPAPSWCVEGYDKLF